jgi:hypothetical protein
MPRVLASLLGVLLLGALAAAAVAGGEPDERVLLDADAFRSHVGATVRLLEASEDPEANAPVIQRLEIARPALLTAWTPPRRATLGALRFFVGPHTSPTSPDRRSLRLRRVRSLGDGAYLLGDAVGARVVLSTRYHTRFLDVSLPDGARNVQVTLRGSRLLRLPRCRTVTFEARFTQADDVDRDRDAIPRGRLRRAGLC